MTNYFIANSFVFLMGWTVLSAISNVFLYANGYRKKLKAKKKLPQNKPIEQFKYEIVNVLEDIGMTGYAVVKYNLIVQDKLSRGSILSILCVFLFPYPIIRLEWEYEEEESFQITDHQLDLFKTYEDIVSYYDRHKDAEDAEKSKRDSLYEKINLINSQNGKR